MTEKKNQNNGTEKKQVTEDEALKAAVLLCLYLSSWTENSRKNPGALVTIAWKGYLFSILDQLSIDKLIYQKKEGRSVLITEKGLELAEQLKGKFYQMLDVQENG